MSLSDTTTALSNAALGRIAGRIDGWWVDLPQVNDRQAALELVRSFERATRAPGLAQLGLLPFLQPVAAGVSRVSRFRSAGPARFARSIGGSVIVLGLGSRLLDAWRRTSAEIRVLGAIVGTAHGRSAPELSSLAIQLFLDPSAPPDASAPAAGRLRLLARHVARDAVRRRPDEATTARRIDAAFQLTATPTTPAIHQFA